MISKEEAVAAIEAAAFEEREGLARVLARDPRRRRDRRRDPKRRRVLNGIDQDALHASLDLVRRAGASEVEFGFLDEGVPVEEARWYAHAKYRGARVQVPETIVRAAEPRARSGGGPYFRGPVEAVEALARRLLTGARCRRCGQEISLDDSIPGCRWTRNGKSWTPGCGLPIDHSIPAPT